MAYQLLPFSKRSLFPLFCGGIFLFLSSCGHNGEVVPRTIRAVDGAVMLHDQDPYTAPLSIEGEFSFYWEKLLTPISPPSTSSSFIEVPLAWNHQSEKSYPAVGFGTYRLQIEGNMLSPEKWYALEIPVICNSYRLWVNGKKVAEVGFPGSTKETTKPAWQKLIAPVQLKEKNELILQVASFRYRMGGLVDKLTLGSYERLQEDRISRQATSLFLSGSLLMAAMLFLGLFVFWQKDLAVLFYVMYCLILGYRTLITEERFLYTLFPDFPWEIGTRSEFLTVHLAFASYFLFVRYLFPKSTPHTITKIIVWVSLLASLLTIVLPLRWGSELIFPFDFFILLSVFPLVFTLFRAIKRNETGALVLMGGMLASIPLFVYDILSFFGLFPRFPLAIDLGLLFFAIMQSVVLSYRFALSFRMVDALRRDSESKIQQLQRQQHEIEEQNVELSTQGGELRTQNEVLAQTLKKLKETQTYLVHSEKLATLGQLTAGLAHEINNPLNYIYSGIIGLKKVIKKIIEIIEEYRSIPIDNPMAKLSQVRQKEETFHMDELLAQVDKVIENIETGTRRTTNLIEELQIFARNEQPELASFQVNDGLESTMLLLSNLYKGKATVEKDFADLPEVEAYGGQLNQVFMNLLTNALQSMEDDGLLHVKTRMGDNKVQIIIRDNGTGIPEEIQSHIFEPFFTTKSTREGTGLGLAISLQIVQQHQGTITFYSVEKEGTTFIIELPLQQSIS